MASRDIANMHMFLEMKKKFPDLSDDTLRNYILLYAEDQEKCSKVLQDENKVGFNPRQSYIDFQTELKSNPMKSKCKEQIEKQESSSVDKQRNLGAVPKCNPFSFHSPISSHATISYKTHHNVTDNEPKSAPVASSHNKTFSRFYKHQPISSHGALSNFSNDNCMIFSTTKEHAILAPSDNSNKHAVKLSITPSFPYQQQSSVTASHSSRPGHHTTSLNFELQPSVHRPLQISSIPANTGHSNNFGSHIQISVGSQGATFTALRFQKPQLSIAQISSQVPYSNKEYSSRHYEIKPSQEMETTKQDCFNFQSSNIKPIEYQESQEYVKAVLCHQAARLRLVLEELDKTKEICSQLRTDVNSMESQIAHALPRSSFSYAQELQKLREENRQLRIECNCLLMETDSSDKDQIPVRMKDEDFYSNIFTGPNGIITSSTQVEEEEWKCKECTFANHPALQKCEICELPRNSGSFFEDP